MMAITTWTDAIEASIVRWQHIGSSQWDELDEIDPLCAWAIDHVDGTDECEGCPIHLASDNECIATPARQTIIVATYLSELVSSDGDVLSAMGGVISVHDLRFRLTALIESQIGFLEAMRDGAESGRNWLDAFWDKGEA